LEGANKIASVNKYEAYILKVYQMRKTIALKSLFSISPYSWLVAGTHSSVYANAIDISTKDDQNYTKERYLGSVTPKDIEILMDDFMPTGNMPTLDVTVNGREFALSKLPIVLHGEDGWEFAVTARHRLTPSASLSFISTIALTLP